MLIRRHHFLLREWVDVGRIFRGLKVLDSLARNGFKRRRTNWVAEEGDGISVPRTRLPIHTITSTLREHDPMNRAPEQPIGPVREQIANVDEDRRAWVILGACRANRNRGPAIVSLEDLETCLALQPEEQRDRAIV